MRRYFHIYLFLICSQCWSQPSSAEPQVGGSYEKYRMLTDRSIYMVGEDIHVRIFNLSTDLIKDMDWSKVFYTELISPEGFSHTQTKMAMDSTGTSGTLKIPEEIPSGTYFLKGYTRWMRNDGPSKYTYLSIEIVNPFIKSVLRVDTLSDYRMSLMKHEPGPAGGANSSGLTRKYAPRTPVRFDRDP